MRGRVTRTFWGAGLARAIEDVDAAMAYLRAQPWADPERADLPANPEAASCPSRMLRDGRGRFAA